MRRNSSQGSNWTRDATSLIFGFVPLKKTEHYTSTLVITLFADFFLGVVTLSSTNSSAASMAFSVMSSPNKDPASSFASFRASARSFHTYNGNSITTDKLKSSPIKFTTTDVAVPINTKMASKNCRLTCFSSWLLLAQYFATTVMMSLLCIFRSPFSLICS